MQTPRTGPPSTSTESTYATPRLLWTPASSARDTDTVTVEEPLELRLGSVPIAVVMRTPGHDEELGTGFAITERIVESFSDVARVHHSTVGEHADNVLFITPRGGVELDASRLQRNLYASSSCGICGKRTIEQALSEAAPFSAPLCVKASVMAALPEKLLAQQPTFALTGGLHAAGLFDEHGSLLVVREDIGRHNAVDKVVGWALREGLELGRSGLVISGRASYEIVQKALAARISLVVAVGAVSSLSAELASRARMTLIGFARKDRLSIYGAAEIIGE